MRAVAQVGVSNQQNRAMSYGMTLAGRGHLAPRLDADHAADSVAAVASHEVDLRLTGHRGWTREAYRTWLGGRLTVLLRR